MKIHICNLCQTLCSLAVIIRASRALEQYRVGNDGRQQEARNRGRNIHITLPVHVRYNGGCATHRLHIRAYGLAGLDTSETMMIDDFQDCSFLDALNSLAALVMVYHDDPLALRHHQLIAAHQAHDMPILYHRVIAEVRLLHGALDIRQQVQGLKAYRIVVHDTADGHALIDKACYGVCIIGRGKHKHMLFLGCLNDIRRHAAIARHHQAGYAQIHAINDGLIVTVTDKHDIIVLDDALDGLEAARCYAYIALDEFALFAGDQHLAVRGLDNITVTHAHIGKVLHAQLLEVTICQVTDRHDAHQYALAVRYRHGLQIMLPHDLPQMTQGIVLLDHDLAIQCNILHPRIKIRQEQGLLHTEVLQRIFRLCIDLACPCSNHILTQRLLQVCIADG